MKKILTGNEQNQDTFVTTLVKLFGIEKYNVMERFCEEVEMSFSILNERNVKADEYFEFLNSIKFDLMEEYRTILENCTKDNTNVENLNVNSQTDAMDMDDNQKDGLINITQLLDESYFIEPSHLKAFSNPLYNTNFYIIFILILIINNQMDSARYLYRRLPEPILKNRTIVFIKKFLSHMLKKDVGKAISILNEEIEIEIKKEKENTEKEEDLIEEDIMDRIPTKVNKKMVHHHHHHNNNNNSNKNYSHHNNSNNKEDEKMDIYPSDKSSDIAGPSNKGRVIENNTPEQSSDNIIDVPQQQVDTPEEPMKDIEYDDNDTENGGDDDDNDDEEEENDDDDDDDNEDTDENDNDDEDMSKSDNLTIKINKQNIKQIINETMTPVDTETPISFNEVSVSITATSTAPDAKKTYYKIKRCSLFIKELLICLLDKTRKRQINLIAKAYDHVLVKEVAKSLDYSEENVISFLTKNYGWEVEPAQDRQGEMMFLPKREIKEKKQEMSINHIDTLISHLIFLEDSDKIQKISHF